MKRDKKQSFKVCVEIASLILGLAASVFFMTAVFLHHQETANYQQEAKVHVYINENDSLINQLQQDVSRLNIFLDNLQSDTLIITHTVHKSLSDKARE